MGFHAGYLDSHQQVSAATLQKRDYGDIMNQAVSPLMAYATVPRGFEVLAAVKKKETVLNPAPEVASDYCQLLESGTEHCPGHAAVH